MLDFSCLIKYFLEGLAVAVAAFVLPARGLPLQEVLLIALTAAATFAALDQFAPEVGRGARFGAGFGVGLGQVGGNCGGAYDGASYLEEEELM